MEEKKQARRVSQSLPPPKEVGGLGITHSRPKQTQIPDFPSFYPNELKPKTAVILAEAVRRFPEQTQMPELCRYVISKMNPVFCAAVQTGTRRADLALSDMENLLHSLLVYNDNGPRGGFSSLSDEGYRLERATKRFDEWTRFARAIDRAARRAARMRTESQGDSRPGGHLTATNDAGAEKQQDSQPAGPVTPTKDEGTGRRALVSAYIEEVLCAQGKRITRKDIWSAAGYKSRTEFERWERKDPKHVNKAAHENFTRILREKPHLK